MLRRPTHIFKCEVLLVFVSHCWIKCESMSTQCINQNGNAVDWFIAYKLPTNIGKPDNSFFYMDAQSTAWSLSQTLITAKTQAIFYTMKQIYQLQNGTKDTNSMIYAMYNDEIPRHKADVKYGHTKGVVAFDSHTGFWLVHSTPQFPSVRSEGYKWPANAVIYAQSFLCVSLDTARNLDQIGYQFQYIYPKIYDKNIPESFKLKYPAMANALKGAHVAQEPWFRQAVLTSLAGVQFISFAKFSRFSNDLYAAWLAPTLKADLLVETWMNSANPLSSNCTGKYKVYNVKSVKFASFHVDFKETKDHAKWAITNSTNTYWTCIGDINRQACNSGFRKRFLLRTTTNTDGEELIMDAHEISVQSDVVSGLEDVNSSHFFIRSNMNNLRGHSLKLYKEHFRRINEYSKFGSTFHT